MQNNQLTLGSLFDGSGGFPLAGLICGIAPIWASEIEPFPIRVTTKRLPQVKHLGDICNINGAEIEPVDIITFGSPCQDLSIAGKRAGLENGERSNLFYQAIRIVKEMRCVSNGKYPRFIVWENVTGAFSSNKGEDFKAVLTEICKVKNTDVSIPKSEKWENAGSIVADDFSLAWRVFDSQFWGVPQRRKRIYLVADFDGECAGKVLFESESLSGYLEKSCLPWQRTAGTSESCTGKTGGICLNDQGGNRIDITDEMTCTLRAEAHHPPCVMGSAGFCTERSAKSRSIGFENEKSPTLRAGIVPAAVYENHSQDTRYTELGDVAPTVSSTYGTGGNNQPFVVETFDVRFTSENTKNARHNVYETDTARTVDTGGNHPESNQGGIAVIEGNGSRPSHHGNGYNISETMSTLNTVEQHAVAYGIDRAAFNQGKNAQFGISVDEEIEPPVVARGPGAVARPTYCTSKASYHTLAEKELANTLVATDYKDPPVINDVQYVVRRLTPTECARLQGFPDWWCSELETENPTDADIEKWREVFNEYARAIGKNTKSKADNQIRKWLQNPHSDSAEYKMWGNGICLNNAVFVLAGIAWAANI
ncbi:MAG: DNA (cytosine-5-)-methyltransferase [Clostridiales bacterium]|nr:DNA (cytosine-5-)-methyltransferase [Clostridiales bacterium]